MRNLTSLPGRALLFALLIGSLAACQAEPTPLWTTSRGTPLPVLKNPDLQSRLAAGETLRIMPLGDSITEGFCDRASNCEWPAEIKFPSDGYGVEGCYTNTTIVNPGSKGYREFLGNRLLESGIDFTYVGSVDVVAGLAHEGHSGFTISDLDYCIQNAGWLEQAKPDIILLHIGTNDAGLIQQPTVMLTSLRALLTQIYQESPATTEVILALVIPAREGTRVDLDPSMPMANEILAEYNAGIPAVVDEFRAMGKHVSLVDMWNTVQSPQEYDQMGLHPNPVAAERMAQVWFEKIIEILEGQ